jgi:hypothetical protein
MTPTANHETFIARAEATGRWWENAWWEDPQCEIHFTVPRQAVSRGAAAMHLHFDDAWYRDLAATPRPNLLFPKLCLERSTFALEFIASFGARLERLKDADNLQRPLKVLRESYGDSALLELEAAEAFAESGFQISFPVEGPARSPDILARKGDQLIAIECKRLGDEQWEGWESELMHEISRALPHEHDRQEIVVEVVLNRRLSEVRFGGAEYDVINRAVMESLKQSILDAVGFALSQNKLPVEITLPDIARIRIAAKAPGLFGSVSGMERSIPATFRRIFQNAIFRALEQLPKGVPGTIILFSKHAPPPAFFRLLFDATSGADHLRFDDLVGVMVCTLQTWFERPRPWYFANRHTAHAHASTAVKETLTKSFRAQIA